MSIRIINPRGDNVLDFSIDRSRLKEEKFLVSTADWGSTHIPYEELVKDKKVIFSIEIPCPIVSYFGSPQAEEFVGDQEAWEEGTKLYLTKTITDRGFKMEWLANDAFFSNPQAHDPEFLKFLEDIIYTSSSLRTPTYPRTITNF